MAMFNKCTTKKEAEDLFEQWKNGDIRCDCFELIEDFVTSKFRDDDDPWYTETLSEMKGYI